MKTKIGINGFGRIGRVLFRHLMNDQDFEVVAINEINPDNGNIAYQLNYDTIYGSLSEKYTSSEQTISSRHHNVRLFHSPHIDEVPWDDMNCAFVIDSSGVLDNVARAKNLIGNGYVKKVFVTHYPKQHVDFTMVLGANETEFDLSKHHIISSSICDATAMAPVMSLVHQNWEVESGFVTTLHPWLSYQNLMDGPASSWSVPGEIYHHYAIGRSSIGNLIPKPTSALDATIGVVKELPAKRMGSFSYRTPTAIVGSADITLNLRHRTTSEDVVAKFNEYEAHQKWPIIHNSVEPLVSLDYKQAPYSAVVDNRWTQVVDGRLLKLVLWYDNEWGYAHRVVDQVRHVSQLLEKV